MELTNEIKDYLAKLDNIIKLEEQLKADKKALAEQDMILAQRMRDENVEALKVDGIEFKPIDDIQFSLADDAAQTWDNPTFFNWLRDNKLGDIIKIKETVHYQTRVKVLKEVKEEGRELPPFIKVGFYTHLKFNKSAVERRNA